MIITFDTTHHALWAEEIALARGLAVDVIPAPADSGARCDLALEVLPEDADALVSALVGEGVPHRIYAPQARGYC